jgi:dTDP-glucose pyrophosphorylase
MTGHDGVGRPEPGNVGLSVVMPMAGRGSRFATRGISEPKPLIELAGRPFFWWAMESVCRATPIDEMVFVVLEEHCRHHAVDQRIAAYYPQARVVAVADVTSGPAESAFIGARTLRGTGPMAVNDCDHAFVCRNLPRALTSLRHDADGALLCFPSDDPGYSYARFDADGAITGTAEKVVVGPLAIAGCYMFATPASFLQLYEEYRADCPYDELFISGMFNLLVARGGRILKVDAVPHVSFGTPEECEQIDPRIFERELNWTEPPCLPVS